MHVALDRTGVVGLDVDRAEGRPVAAVEPLEERVDRRCERQLDGREPPALVHRARIAVRREDFELEHVGALRSKLGCGLADELVRDALPACLGPHVKKVEEAEAVAGLRRDGETDVVGEQDDVLADRLLQLAQVLLRVVVVPFGVGDFHVEGVPQLAHECEIVGGCVANHWRRCASKR